MGLEDYSTNDNKRLISCARNLFAGILLLFKHKLSVLSPHNSNEVLIKERVYPSLDSSGNLQWVGKGKKTVDVQQIKERFKSLNITVQWDRVDRINDFRNNIEHYFSNMPHVERRAIISDSFIIIRDFLSEHLQEDPKEFLGDIAWNTLIAVSEIYKKEKEECIKNIETIDWDSESLLSAITSFICPSCSSGLISVREHKPDKHDNVFYCKCCDASWTFEEFAVLALSDYFSFDSYEAIKDGGVPPLILCPECFLESYIIEEQYCPICEAEAEHECQRCGMPIPAEEIDGSGFCSYCAHKMSKGE